MQKKKKKIVDPLLIKECTKNIDETELVRKTSNENECRCSLCTVYKVLFFVFFVFFVKLVFILFIASMWIVKNTIYLIEQTYKWGKSLI